MVMPLDDGAFAWNRARTPLSLWAALARYWLRLLLFGLPLWLAAAELQARVAPLMTPGPAFLAAEIGAMFLAALMLPVWRRILEEPLQQRASLRLVWTGSGWRMVLLGLVPAWICGGMLTAVLLREGRYGSMNLVLPATLPDIVPWAFHVGLPPELFSGLFLAGAAIGFFYVERRLNGLSVSLGMAWRQELRLFVRVLGAGLLCMLLHRGSALVLDALAAAVTQPRTVWLPEWLATRMPFALGHVLVPLILAQRLSEARLRAEHHLQHRMRWDVAESF